MINQRKISALVILFMLTSILFVSPATSSPSTESYLVGWVDFLDGSVEI